MTLRIATVLLLLIASVSVAQEPTPAVPAARSTALNVYLDCETSGCDFDFFRTELNVVNWVRDRQAADVHILVTTQQTGAGGREYSVNFIGLRRFAGIVDTLVYVSPPAASQDDQRRGLARVFRLGLVRYLARTPAAERLTIGFGEQTGQGAQATARTDRWNNWVFRTSLRGFSFGEESVKDNSIFGNINADRITEQWKTRLSVNESYNQSEFKTSDTTSVVAIRRSYGGSVLQVKSLGQHWSGGLRASISSSTYDNFQRVLRLAPALEYNVFPYAQSTRRQLRIEYNIGYADFAYHDTTIFDKLAEGMPTHRLLTSVATREQWGSIDVGINGTQYLHDLAKYRIGSFVELSLQLFRGFSFDAFGNYNIIRDQFGLAKKTFSEEEILTRQFQLGTRYRYFGNFGFSYTFGSIYNNVVNPRMSEGFFD